MKNRRVVFCVLAVALVLGGCGDVTGPRVPRTDTAPKTSDPGTVTHLEIRTVERAWVLA